MIDIDRAIDHARCTSCNSSVDVRAIAFGPHGTPMAKTVVYCCTRCLVELALQLPDAIEHQPVETHLHEDGWEHRHLDGGVPHAHPATPFAGASGPVVAVIR